MSDFNKDLIADMRANGGRPTSGPFLGRDVMILTVRGAKSGEPREIPLAFSYQGDHVVVVASKGGAPTHPAWYHNLVANPEVRVEIFGDDYTARARIATDEEYEDMYKHHADLMPGFWEYRQKTSRKIPVIVLERVTAGQRAS